jgi:hypothetical protein
MTAFLLFIVTALATGWQLSQQILMGVWGKPLNPLELVGFTGSLILLASAYVALFSMRRALWGAVVATALLWTFYLPALATTVSADGPVPVIVFGPGFLLGCTTGLLIFELGRCLRKKNDGAIPTDAPPKIFRRGVLLLTGFAVLSIIVLEVFFVGVDREVSAPVTYAIEKENGRSVAKMTFQNLAGLNFIETDSKEVIGYLETNHPRNISVRISMIYDFGKVRALNLTCAYLGDIKFRPYVERNP